MSATEINIGLILLTAAGFVVGWTIGEARAARGWEATFRESWRAGYELGKKHGESLAASPSSSPERSSEP